MWFEGHELVFECKLLFTASSISDCTFITCPGRLSTLSPAAQRLVDKQPGLGIRKTSDRALHVSPRCCHLRGPLIFSD